MPYIPNKKETILEYKSAPSGYITIEKWEPPFMKVEKGFGFIGVIATDKETEQLQCHLCGEWFKSLSSHIYYAHKMSGNEYRDMFNLLRSTALQNKSMRLSHSITAINNIKSGKMNFGNKGRNIVFTKGNKYAANRKGKRIAGEYQNKYGVCDLQIIDRIKRLADKMDKTPTLVDLMNEYGGGFITVMNKRYGSYIRMCRDNGLFPNYSSKNPRTTSEWKELLLTEARECIKTNKKITSHGPMRNRHRKIKEIFGSWSNLRNNI